MVLARSSVPPAVRVDVFLKLILKGFSLTQNDIEGND